MASAIACELPLDEFYSTYVELRFSKPKKKKKGHCSKFARYEKHRAVKTTKDYKLTAPRAGEQKPDPNNPDAEKSEIPFANDKAVEVKFECIPKKEEEDENKEEWNHQIAFYEYQDKKKAFEQTQIYSIDEIHQIFAAKDRPDHAIFAAELPEEEVVFWFGGEKHDKLFTYEYSED